MRFGICVVTLNAGSAARDLIASVNASSLQPDRKLVIDSGSRDGTADVFASSGFELLTISGCDFDHAATRQLAVGQLADCEIVVFLTQDVVLAEDALERLLSAFSNVHVAAAYGRQLPAQDATPIAAHARLFNYPATTALRTLKDRARLGIKAAFFSNAFAAYRRERLCAAGGFPQRSIFGEDTLLAAKMLLSEEVIAYCGDAEVVHSHNYSLTQEFRRYFDIGVMHSRESWFRQSFGAAEGEGRRFVFSELTYLSAHAPLLIPAALLRTLLKLIAYRLGLAEKLIPLGVKKQLSMNQGYWHRE